MLAGAEYWGSWDRIEPLMRAPSLDEVGKGGVRVSGDWWSENLMRSWYNTQYQEGTKCVPGRGKEIIVPGRAGGRCGL